MIIFLYGPDTLRSGRKLKEIKEKFLRSDPAAAGLSVFDLADKDLRRDPLSAVGAGNLLSPKRLVVIKNLIGGGSEDDQERIAEYFKKNKNLESDRDTVVVFWEAAVAKKSHLLFKFLEKHSTHQIFEKLIGAKLNNWIMARIKEIDSKGGINTRALEKLVLYAGGDVYVMDREIMKLANYASGRIITEADIDLLVNANIASSIFETIDALGNRNKKQALQLLHRHLKSGEDPFYIFSMFVYQFRNLLKVADFSFNEGRSEQEIAKISKLHPYVVKKSLMQIQSFSFEQLKKIYQKLGETDLKIKTGQLDIKLALDKFIVEL